MPIRQGGMPIDDRSRHREAARWSGSAGSDPHSLRRAPRRTAGHGTELAAHPGTSCGRNGRLEQEAEQDIHRKYLPWAVLFGLTERWNEVCREMAAETHVEVPDASFSDAADDFTSAASSAVTQQQFNPFYTDPGMEDHSDNFWKSSDDSSSSGSSSGISSSGGGSGSGGSRAGSW